VCVGASVAGTLVGTGVRVGPNVFVGACVTICVIVVFIFVAVAVIVLVSFGVPVAVDLNVAEIEVDVGSFVAVAVGPFVAVGNSIGALIFCGVSGGDVGTSTVVGPAQPYRVTAIRHRHR
jgi:hypothetical protein